jgi:hypothetical protein
MKSKIIKLINKIDGLGDFDKLDDLGKLKLLEKFESLECEIIYLQNQGFPCKNLWPEFFQAFYISLESEVVNKKDKILSHLHNLNQLIKGEENVVEDGKLISDTQEASLNCLKVTGVSREANRRLN